jgi:hypothetical protein
MGGDTEGAATRGVAERMPYVCSMQLMGLHVRSSRPDCSFETTLAPGKPEAGNSDSVRQRQPMLEYADRFFQ